MHTLLIRLGQILERRATAQASLVAGLSYSEVCLLDALSEAGERGLSRGQLADQIHLTPSAVSRALKPMEKLGYTASERDERDARNSRAVLTAAGRARFEDALAGLEELWSSMDLSVFGMNADQLGQALDYLLAPRPRLFGMRPDWAAAPARPPLARTGPPPQRPDLKLP